MIQRIRSFERKLIRFESLIAALSLLLLLVLSLIQIFIRNLLDFGYPEIDIINRNLLVICGSMGAVACTGDGEYIALELLAEKVYGFIQRNMSPGEAAQKAMTLFDDSIDVGLII